MSKGTPNAQEKKLHVVAELERTLQEVSPPPNQRRPPLENKGDARFQETVRTDARWRRLERRANVVLISGQRTSPGHS